MYRGFHERILEVIEATRQVSPEGAAKGARRRHRLEPAETAWALIGLATVSNIIRELDLTRSRERRDLFARIARHLIRGESR
jgi:hypothetical protein